MRVVAGCWRGRRLVAPRGDATRPTTDRVKEALFSILGPSVVDVRVADLCCGSGGLGIEALSRGAAHATFVDRDRAALDAVRRNLEACGADSSAWRAVRADALEWLGTGSADLVLADPPYAGDLPRLLWRALIDGIAHGDLERAVLEHDPALDLTAPPPGVSLDRRIYGATALSILEKSHE